LFVQHKALRPGEYAALAGFYPARAAWSYLKRLARAGKLHRRRDWKGRLLYSLSRDGAQWLLWWKKYCEGVKRENSAIENQR